MEHNEGKLMDFDSSDFEAPTEERFDPTKEPSAQIIEAVREMRHLYVALVREGFSEGQALVILGTILSKGQG